MTFAPLILWALAYPNLLITAAAVTAIALCFKQKKNKKKKTSKDAMDKPREILPETPEQRAALKEIRKGKMRGAREDDTLDDAVSNWGDVQNVEGMTMMKTVALTAARKTPETWQPPAAAVEKQEQWAPPPAEKKSVPWGGSAYFS